MKSDKIFWLGVAVTIVGVVLMSLPAKRCEDCEVDLETDAYNKVTDSEAEDAESPLND